MTGSFNAMSKSTLFLLCATLAVCFRVDAATEFPYYNGGSHTIITNETTTDSLWLGDTAANTSLQILSNAVVVADRIDMNGNDNVVTNQLLLKESSQLIIGTTTFSTTNPASLVVGSDSDAGIPSVSMDNAARLETENLYLGADSGDTGSIVLTGEDTILVVSDTANIGIEGSDNTIDISDEAVFKVEGNLNLGSATSTNNVITAKSGGTLFVGSLTDIDITGYETQTNQVVIKKNGTLEVGGNLHTEDLKDRGILLETDANVAVNGELSAKNSAIENIDDVGLNILLNTSNSLWNVTGGAGASVGLNTGNNSLSLSDGAQALISTTLRVGKDKTASENTLEVLDGSLLSVGGTNHVGFFGSSNTLRVNNASVEADSLFLGSNDGADKNEFIMEENANVTIANDFIVGNSGNGNIYDQTGGTNTVTGNFIIGNTEKATGNNATLNGSNSMLNASSIIIGNDGASNWLKLENGAQVMADTITIGVNTNNNYIQLNDSNTVLTVGTDLTIGENGENNRLTINGGTANIGNDLIIGANTNNNSATISSTNSTINISNALVVGKNSSENTLTVRNGGEVNTFDAFIGQVAGLTNNVVNISGNDSLLSVSNDLVIGSNTGSNNTVNVGSGGTLFVKNDISFGTATNDLNNKLNVNSRGRLHTIDWDYATVSTNIILNSGSTLELDGTFSGTNQLDGGFELTLNGTSSATNWNTGTNLLYVGYNNDGNTLTVKDDGFVTTSTNLIIGRSASTIDNTLSITGLNARVEIGNNLIVGNSDSSGNSLEVLDGGTVHVANNLTLGSRGNNNTALLKGLEGATVSLTITNNLIIGSKGSGNTFEISSNTTANVGGNITVGDSGKNNRYFQTGGTNTVSGEFIIGRTADATGETGHVDDDVVETTGNLAIVGTNSILNIQQNLTVGQEGGGSIMTIRDGGTVNVSGDTIIGEAVGDNYIYLQRDSNTQFNVAGDLVVGKEGGSNRFAVYGGTADIAGSLYLDASTNLNENNNFIHLETTNAVLNVASNFYAGYAGNDNSVTIKDGATASVSNDVYIGYASSNNWIEIVGSNSALIVLNDMFVGNSDTNISGNNEFRILDSAMAQIDGNLSIASGRFEIESGSKVNVSGDYIQDEFSTLLLHISTNSSITNLVVDGTATLEKDSSIEIKADETIEIVVGESTNYSQVVVSAGTIKVDEEDATSANLNDDINISTEGLIDFDLTVSNNTLVIGNLTRLSLASRSDLVGTQLEPLADEIDAMADSGSNEVAEVMRDILNDLGTEGRNSAFDNYYGEKSSSTPANNIINLGLQHVAEQLTMRADNTRSRNGIASSSVNWDKPTGVAGPHESGQELQGWISAYSSWADHSGADGFNSYDANINGFMIGADLAVADNILVGVAGGTGRGSIDKDNDADTDTKTTYGAVYVSSGTKDWFADASFIYGGSSVDSTLGSTFDTTADYDARNIAFYFGGGKEIAGQYLIFTPQASLLGNYYKQDSYTEDATTAVGREVDSFDALYIQSSIGGSMGFYAALGNVTLKPELRAYWLHEWNADEEKLDYSLIGGANSYTMLLQAPEEDILKLGIGTSAKLGDYLELRADLDTRIGSDYSDYTLLGSLRYQF
jgi:T5SS/PEP-CTERM-associated repeat protein